MHTHHHGAMLDDGQLAEGDAEIIQLKLIPVGLNVWGFSQHKPLLMYTSFPLCRHPPLSLKRTRYVDELCGDLQGGWEGVPG